MSEKPECRKCGKPITDDTYMIGLNGTASHDPGKCPVKNNQYGIKLRDAREPLWIVGPWETQQDLMMYITNNYKNKAIVTLVGGEEVLVSYEAIDMMCGPNSPGKMSIFRR